MKRFWSALLVMALLVLPRASWSYSLGTAFSTSCHERLTARAARELTRARGDVLEVALPDDERWSAISEDLLNGLAQEAPELPWEYAAPQDRFIAFSMLLGARFPDTRGHSIIDLNALRRIHADNSPEGQHAHCLRAPSDDGAQGDLEALSGTKALIERLLDQFITASQRPPREQWTETEFYLDHYGLIRLTVHEPAFVLGQALHAIQDCFSHTLRTADARSIVTVFNFVEAVDGKLETKRDGLAHSNAMDECQRPEVARLVQAAEQQSLAVTRAAIEAARRDSSAPIQRGLSPCGAEASDNCGWIEYADSCQDALNTASNLESSCCQEEAGFCESPWLSTARRDASRAYIPNAIGCSTSGGRRPLVLPLLFALALATLGWRRGRLHWRHPNRGWPWLMLLAMSLISSASRACPARFSSATKAGTAGQQAPLDERGLSARRQRGDDGGSFVTVEAHASALTDATNEALLDVSFGPALRGGYRLGRSPLGGRWGLVAVIEQNAWLESEQDFRVRSGTLNFGLGFELLFGGMFRSSAVVGTSTLLFDALFHDAGTTGLYADLRPLGVRLDLAEHWVLALDPISGTWLAPSFGHASLVQFQYRLTVGIEWRQGL